MSHTLAVGGPAIPLFLGQAALEPVRLSGREGVNSLFEYELLLKTPDSLNLGASGAANFNLDQFIGREVTCSIELDGSGFFASGAVGAAVDRVGSGSREISALVTSAQFWGEEGRRIQYKLTLRPWLHVATLSVDCKVFQNKSVVEILDELLADYPFPVDKRLYERYPARDYQVQYNESDFAFFERLCQEWGISYHFEHSGGKHRLVLCDAMAAYPANVSAAYQQVEYHAPGWKIDAEYIHSFAPEHHLTSGGFATTEYDYTQPRADLSARRSDPRPTGQADGEVYQWHDGQEGSHYAQPNAGSGATADTSGEGRFISLLRMQQLRNAGARSKASGNLRGMQPGHTFKLALHPRENANAEYLILDTHLLIEDVGQDSQVKGSTGTAGISGGRGQQWRVQVEFAAHPVGEQLRPAHTRTKPHTHGPQTALVVGPEGQSLWTDELGRIKVQFPWDRIGAKNQHSSCWVRVSSPWAGNQLGGVHIPRIGQEVIIDFIGGDPDLPICTGRVANQVNLPPWKLPGQSALSGFRSRELNEGAGNSAAGRSNHLVMDDTAGQIQTQLKSDHQHSSLSLGHITRIEDNEGRKDQRGDGFELRTDGHGVARAAQGLLITTEARTNASGHAKDLGDAMDRLAIARDLVEGQADAARASLAQAKGDQDRIAKDLKKLNDGIRGSGGDASAGHFPELASPHLVLASPSGFALTSGGATHIASVEHTQLTSSKHTSINSGQSLIAVALEAFKVYAMQNGMQMVAAQADIEINALKNSIKMAAKEKIELVADEISITAKTKLSINGGTSYGEFVAGGITTGTAGPHKQHADGHSTNGPDSRPTVSVSVEACGTKEKLADSGLNFVARS